MQRFSSGRIAQKVREGGRERGRVGEGGERGEGGRDEGEREGGGNQPHPNFPHLPEDNNAALCYQQTDMPDIAQLHKSHRPHTPTGSEGEQPTRLEP